MYHNNNNNNNDNNNMGRRSGLKSLRVVPLPCRAGRTQPELLLVASTGWHSCSMVEKRMATLPGLANLLRVKSWKLTLAVYLNWLVKILVNNVVEPMKWSDSKQLAGYIFARCISLTPSLPLLARLVAQRLLAVSLSRLRSTERSCWE